MLHTGRCTIVRGRGVIGSVEEPGCATLHSSRSADRRENCLLCSAQDVGCLKLDMEGTLFRRLGVVVMLSV